MLKDTSKHQETPENAQEHPATQNDPEAGRAPAGWLSPDEAVKASGIGRTRIYRFLNSGELPSAKIGRTRHIRRRDLDRFLEERMTGTSAAPTK